MTARQDGATGHGDGAVGQVATVRCCECERVFDLTNEGDAEEWFYGHDCEATG